MTRTAPVILSFLTGILLAATTSADSTCPKQVESLNEVITGGRLDLKGRGYFINRHFDERGTQQSLALGGWIDFESAYWHGLGGGMTLYTSQGLFFTDDDKGGGGILTPDQDGYTVLGQAYLQALVSKTRARVYRQELETPLLNRYDCKMTPVTFEALTLETRDIPDTRILVSHVTGIKGWTDTSFKSPTDAAGIEDEDEPITLAGITYNLSESTSVQLWDYFCHQYLNSVYAQADTGWQLEEDLHVGLGAQGIHQQDVGRAVGGEFETGMGGVQSVLSWHGANLTLGFTITDGSYDIVNPWASYPGYTSIMEEDNNRAGEKAVVLGLAYDFGKIGVTGLSAFTYHTQSWTPDTGAHASPDQHETDFTVDYHFPGKLKGLWLRLRNAYVNKDESLGGEDYQDFRVIVNYDLALLGSAE